MAKVGILNPFFSRYFLGVLTRFMALFMAGDTHSLLFSNILLTHHQSITDAFEEEKKNCQERKKMQVLLSFLWVSPIHDTFSVAHVFCVKFLGKNYVLGAFCKADIYAKSKGEQLSTFSEKMHINDLTFGQFFCTEKV